MLVLGAGLAIAPEASADKSPPVSPIGAPQALGSGHDELDLGDGFELRGVPTRMSLFWTDDSAGAVGDLYERTWSAAGLDVKRHRADKVSSVTGFDMDTGVMRSVTIMDSGEDRLVVPNVSTSVVLPDLSSAGAPVPLPEGMNAFTAHRAQDGGRATYVATYVVPIAPTTVIDFYEYELTQLGYQILPSGRGSRDGVMNLEVTRGPETIHVTADATNDGDADKKASLVFINHARVLSGAP